LGIQRNKLANQCKYQGKNICFFFPAHNIYIMLHSFWCHKQHTHFSPHSNHTLKPNYVHTGFEVLNKSQKIN